MFFVFVSLSLCSKIPVPGVLCGDRLLNLIPSLKQLWKYSWPFQTYHLSIGDLKYIDHTILVGTQDWPQDMHPWQSPWLTKIVMSGQFRTFAMFSLIYCCDCLPASASSSFPTRSYISRPVSPVISQTYLADISAFKNQQYTTIKVEEA